MREENLSILRKPVNIAASDYMHWLLLCIQEEYSR